jgi:glycerate kinase
MRVLLAFDKFKDSLSAPEACAITAAALQARHPDWKLDSCPLADGGEGFAAILTRAAGGESVTVSVTGPRGSPVDAAYGLVPLANIPAAARALLKIVPGPSGDHQPNRESKIENPQVAVIEMAAVSGLALLPDAQRDPWQTTTAGTGELIRAAAARGVAAIIVGVGGSATNDLGLGALGALGLDFLTANGTRLAPPVPADWPQITRLAGQVPAALPPVRIACDVTNPLLGARGAAAVYGPQKGLRPADLARLEHESARLGLMLCAHCGQPDTVMDTPGAGAAGGIAFGLMTAARARLLPGFDLVSAWLDLEARISAADLVITGEGRFDESSLSGKGPGAVAARALALGKPVRVFAGQVTTSAAAPAGLHLHAITPAGLPLADALRTAPDLLAAAVRQHC